MVTFKKNNYYSNNYQIENKPWYNRDCRILKKNTKTAEKRYHKNRSKVNLNGFVDLKKQYMRTIKQQKIIYTNNY